MSHIRPCLNLDLVFFFTPNNKGSSFFSQMHYFCLVHWIKYDIYVLGFSNHLKNIKHTCIRDTRLYVIHLHLHFTTIHQWWWLLVGRSANRQTISKKSADHINSDKKNYIQNLFTDWSLLFSSNGFRPMI